MQDHASCHETTRCDVDVFRQFFPHNLCDRAEPTAERMDDESVSRHAGRMLAGKKIGNRQSARYVTRSIDGSKCCLADEVVGSLDILAAAVAVRACCK